MEKNKNLIYARQGTVIFGYARSKLTIEEIRSKCSKTVVAKYEHNFNQILLLPNNLLNLLNSTLSLIRSGEEQLLEDFWAANHYCAGESH